MCSPFTISSFGMYPSPNLHVMLQKINHLRCMMPYKKKKVKYLSTYARFLMDLHSEKTLTFYLLQPPNWSMHPLYKAIREACGGNLYIGCWTSKRLGLQETLRYETKTERHRNR